MKKFNAKAQRKSKEKAKKKQRGTEHTERSSDKASFYWIEYIRNQNPIVSAAKNRIRAINERMAYAPAGRVISRIGVHIKADMNEMSCAS